MELFLIILTERLYLMIYIYRRACTIDAADHVVITGGWPGITRVTAYDDKWHYQFSSIPPLKIGRFDHACGGYDTETGDRVRYTNILPSLSQ